MVVVEDQCAGAVVAVVLIHAEVGGVEMLPDWNNKRMDFTKKMVFQNEGMLVIFLPGPTAETALCPVPKSQRTEL